MRFQPLRHIDDPERRRLALAWLLDLMTEYHVPVTAAVQAHLGANMQKLARYPLHERTLSRFITLMADGARETELKAKAGRIDAQGIAHDVHQRIGVDRRLRQPGDRVNQDRAVEREFLVQERLHVTFVFAVRPAGVLNAAEHRRPAIAIRP